MLCEGSLATRNVGMLMREMMKPIKEVRERVETSKELIKREEFALEDDDEIVEGEEDILLVDNKAATLILIQASGSWRTRHLRVRASSLKQRINKGTQKVIHVPGRSMLADLSTKSHPQSRLAALRRMWSIEAIEGYDPEKIPKEGL
jgi:hypothetical protein